MFLDLGSNGHPLHCKVDSWPLDYDGSPDNWGFLLSVSCPDIGGPCLEPVLQRVTKDAGFLLLLATRSLSCGFCPQSGGSASGQCFWLWASVSSHSGLTAWLHSGAGCRLLTARPPTAGCALAVGPVHPDGSVGEEPACSADDPGSIPGLGGSPREGKGYPPQYRGLEKSVDYTVHGVAKSWTQLSDFHFTMRLLLVSSALVYFFAPSSRSWVLPEGLMAGGLSLEATPFS